MSRLPSPIKWAAGATVALAAIITLALRSGSSEPTGERPSSHRLSTNKTAEAAVDLEPSQLNAIRIDEVRNATFSLEKEALGSIDYDEDLSVQVFSPYQGKIISALAGLGDDVKKGQPLYTIDSPDLIQAESGLIAAAATLELTTKELTRARDLYGNSGVSAREMEQAISDQQTAEGALKASLDAVRLFGKSQAEIDHILAHRKIDPALVVQSPISGRVTSRNAQPGLFVQPGGPTAPYSVADLSLKWMVANVTEGESPLFHVGQPAKARVLAYPDKIYEGKITRMSSAVDPNTHRLMVRCEIEDPKDELRPGMLASFTIRVREPEDSLAMPMAGVVRNGDGTMASWVTTNRHHFEQRILKIGMQQNGQYQVLDGMRPGELAVTDGAVFLSNLLSAPPSD